jgi:2'-5' RNA ligase
MLDGDRESAVIVAIKLPVALERLRSRLTPAARAGIPAHVTILYPFVAPDALTDAHRTAVTAIAAAEHLFVVRFRRVRTWPTVAWLAPEPSEPFARLMAAVASAFPDCPPYGGAVDDVVPHLTLAEGDEHAVALAARGAPAALPFEATVRAMTVIEQGRDGRWRSLWRLPLRP